MLKRSLVSVVIGGFSFSAVAQCGTYCLTDTNQDGTVAPGDFTQWIAYYNSNNLLADINQDGMVTPADYTVWIAEYNKGPNGKCCPGPIYMLTPCEGGAPIFTKSDMSSCEGQYVEYASGEFAFVTLYVSEATIDDSLMQTISIISCADDCGDDPVIGVDDTASSIVVVLASTCEPLVRGTCTLTDSLVDVPDEVSVVRLYRNGFLNGSPNFPKWDGVIEGIAFTVSRDDTTSGMMLPPHERWRAHACTVSWPDVSCDTTCNAAFPSPTVGDSSDCSILNSWIGNYGPGETPAVWDCEIPDAPKGIFGHYAVPELFIISDYDGLIRAACWNGVVCGSS